ncbi:hypothetical protein Nepgr_003673 [Nepenthes gracilis]|uniref:phosphogluconate dehydrogenase (NADP(+)-dependent, decarboxylating) n=1 Tax=Nepenthes gracilis TaxID=150966 RepID=A0AAD3S033_NEPGR|nr:hypothetical protein Nepgr_003673 [Nepenthes gracilis]
MFLDRNKEAYGKNPDLANLFIDVGFSKDDSATVSAWRKVVCLATNSGVSIMSSSLAYFDTYRREWLPLIWFELEEINLELLPMKGLTCLVPFIVCGSKLLI